MTAETRELIYIRALLNSLLTLLLSLCTAAMVFIYLRKRISVVVFTFAIFVLAIIDLWIVDISILKPQTQNDREKYFKATEAVTYLQKDPEIFRIYSVDTDKSENWYIFHRIQNILGPHQQLLNSYKEVRDEFGLDVSVHKNVPPLFSKLWRLVPREGRSVLRPIPPMNINMQKETSEHALLNMLNVKYIISHDELQYEGFQKVKNASPSVFINNQYLPRAFFADSVLTFTHTDSLLNYMKSGNFNPRRIALLETKPPISVLPADSNSVKMISYKAQEIILEADVQNSTILVLSEIYYPDGWRAYVNTRETKIYRTDYILRSIFLTPGRHIIKFVYEPRYYRLGAGIGLISFILVLGVVFFTLAFSITKKMRRSKATASSPK